MAKFKLNLEPDIFKFKIIAYNKRLLLLYSLGIIGDNELFLTLRRTDY